MKLLLKDVIFVSILCCAVICSGFAQENQQPYPQDKDICFALYTVQNHVLKLTAQLYPREEDPSELVTLEIKEMGSWKPIAEEKIILPGWTATFRIDGWDSSQDAMYRVRYQDDFYAGTVRHDPIEKRVIVAAAFTGNSPEPGGGKIPKDDVVRYVNKIDPDVLLFTGDQVYNHNYHTRHWINFGETFGDMIRNRPTVTIPDDHDVGHPNLWGAYGRPAEEDWDGGYLKSPEYVNMVQRQQTSHLPDPYDPTPVLQDISVYYTSLNIGGIDFAIIEDRKFKSGCNGIISDDMGPRPDHVTSPDYDPEDFDLPGKELLGKRQLKFLHEWGKDWDGAVMKSVVSQTVFSMASTYHSKNKLFYYADFDSNGWPQTGRNKAVDLMRRSFSFHICGDQHLSTIVQYGIDDWRDAGWSFCVPSIANLWPRWWQPKTESVNPLPGGQKYTGDYHDGFGNKLTMYAHTNPHETGREPSALHDRMPGFGVVSFDKENRTITMENWPRMMNPVDPASHQYEGWPKTIHQFDNFGKQPIAYLPTLIIDGQENAVVHVYKEDNGEWVYSVRIQGNTFRPKVFENGTYTLKVGEGKKQKVFKGVQSIGLKANKTMILEL